jgi:hypothetical protein
MVSNASARIWLVRVTFCDGFPNLWLQSLRL